MEASAIQAGPGLGRPRITLGSPLLRLRSDQQLVTLFREGNEEAFRVIHDRYRPRLLAYVRQMLPGHAADVEDALQDVFVRTYAGLRTSNRDVSLRPWLYRVAHNRCIDELRRPLPGLELLEAHDQVSDCDPVTETERRESLRRLVVDIRRLPEQQRSALLMREMSGMAYADVACALGISVPAVKSLLVRARIGLAQALEARDAACADIRRELAEAQEEGVRPSWQSRRHLRDCAGCRACRAEMRIQRRQVAALAPTVGPLAVLAKLLGIGTGAGGGTATAASAGGATAAGAGTAASGLATITAGHVATILAAAVVTAGGAVAVQQSVATHGTRHAEHATHAVPASSAPSAPDSTMRVPALTPPRAPSATRGQASSVRGTAPSSTAESARSRAPVTRLPAATRAHAAPTKWALATDSASNTCTPSPPAACTASQTTTCSTGSGSTTSTGTGTTTTGQPPGGTATTATTATTTTTTTPGPATTPGTTSETTAGPGGGTTGSTCTATTQNTATPGTQPTGPGSPGTSTQPSKPT